MRNCLGSLNCEAYANNVRQLKKDNSIFSLLMHASGFALAICNFWFRKFLQLQPEIPDFALIFKYDTLCFFFYGLEFVIAG